MLQRFSTLSQHFNARFALWVAALLMIGGIASPIVAQPGKHGAFTVTAAGTVVNQYAILGANAAAGSSSITVTDITHFSNVAGSPFASAVNRLEDGELLLIIQMQGANVRTTDDADYGIVTNYNGAGTYEFVYVNGATNTNTINLKCALKNSYSTAGRTQIVRVPQFTTLTVNVGASITSTPWNYTGSIFRDLAGTSVSTKSLDILPTTPASSVSFPSASASRGGIVAVHVSGTLTLNGTINVSSHGFRPGLIDNTTSPAGAAAYLFYRTPNDFGGAAKGEGIAGYHTDYDSYGGRYGRGAVANGGGGGNAHNGAGGGGANGHNGNARFRGAGIMSVATATWAQAWALDPDYIANGNALVTTNSGGGRGGYSYANANANALTQGPSNTAWGGDNRDPVGGLGGHAIVNIANSRIFMGGGGGAGENNSNSAERGGRGGGIVYVYASTISGSGQILANGETPPPTRCCPSGTPTLSAQTGNDGASGGGGGGSILVNTTSLGSATLYANGGGGGVQYIELGNESEGAGGGGGGGYITATVALTQGVNAFVNGGQYGTTNSPSLTEFTPNGATSGCDGKVDGSALSSSTIPSYVASCNVDFDEDGISDANDIDDDNDGIPDAYDVCPTGASSNTDFDCLQDILDNDIVNGTGAGIDPSKDEDNDGILNYLDKTDGDGGNDFFNSCTDANADGICDNLPLLIDRDRDGVPNFYDRDSDGDGIADIVEVGGIDIGDGQISALYSLTVLYLDDNEDGSLAGTEATAEGATKNGLLRTYDPDEAGVSLVATIADKDGDGVPNFLDLDSDNDGIPDVIEAGGNDSDGDGKPDVSSDSDGDGYSDAYDKDQDKKLGIDIGPTINTLVYTFDDFMTPNNLAGDQEYVTSSANFRLCPDNHDYKFSPILPAPYSPARYAADVLVNWLDLDSDGDGLPDLIEAGGADADNNGIADNFADTDLDGFNDTYDPDIDLTVGIDAGRSSRPLERTLFDNNSDGLNAEGYAKNNPDGDLWANWLDVDSDDDGMPDFTEATIWPDANSDGFADNDPNGTTAYHPNSVAFADADNDGWGDTKITPLASWPADNNADGKISTEWKTTSGSSSMNFDGDIVPDLYDLDSDNDGILDIDEMMTNAATTFAGHSTTSQSSSLSGYEDLMRSRYEIDGFNPPNSDNAADGYDYRDIDSDADNHRDWIEGFDGTNDANVDALYEYILKANAWTVVGCGSHSGCTSYQTSIDADADGYPAFLDMNDASATSNQGTNFTPPFLDLSSAYYFDVDEDGLVDFFDPTYNGRPSLEPATTTGANTPSQYDQVAGAGTPNYRNNSLVNVTLPVEWVLADAQPNGNNSILYWQLSQENLIDFYQIEKSFSGQQDEFKPISDLIDATNIGSAYSFSDPQALSTPAAAIYYRIRAVGVNGGVSYSPILALSTQGREIHMVAYPNPAHESLTVETTLEAPATLRLISAIGQTVFSTPVEMGTSSKTLSIGNIPPGVYMLVLSDGSAHIPVLIQ